MLELTDGYFISVAATGELLYSANYRAACAMALLKSKNTIARVYRLSIDKSTGILHKVEEAQYINETII